MVHRTESLCPITESPRGGRAVLPLQTGGLPKSSLFGRLTGDLWWSDLPSAGLAGLWLFRVKSARAAALHCTASGHQHGSAK
jgi:hypothetical protein